MSLCATRLFKHIIEADEKSSLACVPLSEASGGARPGAFRPGRRRNPLGYSDGMPRLRPDQPANPNVILAVVSLAALAYAVLSSAVIPALPTFQRSLHASETGVTWLLTGFLLSASVGTAIIGKLGDMYGKQRLLVWTLLALAAGTLLAALAGSL